ncbi:MAG: glycosyltransferase family 2 protein [Candidatus Gastranaerophilales bacterium]|nr:glycosyltransferase family 2 protein [Candidatus Gastranaerophilales bacterium]
MKLFIYLIYFYLTVYTLYYTVLVAAGLRRTKKNRDDYGKKYNNLCVVVYSHNNKETVENLVKQLKNQIYPKANYTIQVILDNCSDESEILFQGDLDVNVMNIKNVDTIGRDQALSIITEKYSSIKDLDAYVFLDAKYYVNNDFLDNVNDALQKDDVLTGAVTLICHDKLSVIDNIKYSYNQYRNNFISTSRAKLGLSNLINSDILAIKKPVIDDIGYVNFKNTNDELKYTLLLSKNNVRCRYSPNLKVYIGVENYDCKIPSLSKRISLFINNLKNIKLDNLNLTELILSLIYPNCITLALGYYLVFQYAFHIKCMLNYYVVGAGIALFLIAFCASLLHSRIHSKEHFYLFCYPAYAVCKVIYNFPPLRFIRNLLFNEKSTHIEKMTAHVYVSDGAKYYPCKLEVISESGLAKVIFINKKKKYKTKNHLRVVDAINEIAQKLESYGYGLKVCQCCKYFNPDIDGSVNQIKGFCKYHFANRTPGDILPTVLWNSCDAFDKMNVVSMFDAIAKKQEEKH